MASVFLPERAEEFASYVRMESVHDASGTYILIFRVLDSNISDALWELALHNVRLFMRWIKATNTRYHFVFDIHECIAIPAARLFELQTYLKKKREMLKGHLHSSVVVTSNRVVELLLRSAFNFVTPARPMCILLCEQSSGTRMHGLPQRTWEAAECFLTQHHLS